MRILSLSKLKPQAFVSATVSAPKWNQPPQFLQFRFFSLHLRQLRQRLRAVPACIFVGAGANFIRGLDTYSKRE